MKTNKEIIDFIEERIGNIYFVPLMYGGSASGVDLTLHYYHELWANIYNKSPLYNSIRDKFFVELDCGAANFSTKYTADNPDATDRDVSWFVVDQWMRISKELGIAIPYTKLWNEYKNYPNSPNLNQKIVAEQKKSGGDSANDRTT